MSQTLRNAVDQVKAALTSAGVEAPPRWLDAISRVLAPHELEALHPGRPDELVAAHFAFMGADLDDVTTIIFLQAMADLFAVNLHATKPAFARVGKNQFMTRIVLGRRLASRYFHEGRRRVDDPTLVNSGTWLLDRCVRISLDIVDRDDRAKPEVRQIMHSQIATSCAHLARARPREDPEREALLRTGLTHSQAADRNGDHSPDHDGYAIELALRLHELTGEDSLDDLVDAVERTRDSTTATLQGLHGDVHFARAMTTWADQDIARAAPHLLAAKEHYDRAITLPRDVRSADIGYHLAKRGRFHAIFYEQLADAAGRRDTIQLDRALADWLDPRSRPHRQDHETARLLLARSRLATARSDTLAAHADIAAAAKLLAAQDPPGPRGRLEGHALGVSIEQALDSADVDMALERLTAAAALRPDAPAPAGSMTKAALWLLGRVPRPEWEKVVQPVLDRVEADTAHPALSTSARGHVTGHAATLARALFLTETAAPAGVLRALELSRGHIDAATTLSAAALDGASTASAMYALLRTDAWEAPSEDALGNWVDALLWGFAALRTEQSVRTSVQARFDIAGCAVRVTDAALRVQRATDDCSYTDTAADALTVAEALAPDPRIDAARAVLATTTHSTTLRLPGRRATRPAGAPVPNAEPATATTRPSHVAWRALADADGLTGEAARRLRQLAAVQFCELIDPEDVSLGGKTRGGRRGVTTVHDPHGLARQLVVLKRVDRDGARREFDAISRVTAWLEGHDAARGWRLPEPLGVVEVDHEDAVFVMRRLPGHTLAHHAMEHLDGRGPGPQRMFEAAAYAMADFHTAMLDGPAARPEDVTREFLRAARQLTSVEVADAADRELRPLLASGAQLAKKDAHAGNWVWSTAFGGLIMLDLEGATTRPVILELATLLDDLPLIGLDNDGWDLRVDIARRYVEALPASHRPKDEELRLRFEAGALHVAVTGMARLQRRGWGASSRGIRYAQFQHRHYLDLTRYLANRAESDHVSRAAAALRTADGL